MSFAGKQVELDIIMLSKISQIQKKSITCFHTYVETQKEGRNGQREGESLKIDEGVLGKGTRDKTRDCGREGG
jgi:hypothetical protein